MGTFCVLVGQMDLQILQKTLKIYLNSFVTQDDFLTISFLIKKLSLRILFKRFVLNFKPHNSHIGIHGTSIHSWGDMAMY